MPRKKKRGESNAEIVIAQYDHVFREMRAAITKVYAATLKWLAAEQARHVETLSKNPFWMQPAYLVQARVEAGLSQQGLADLARISRSAIANVEAGIRITVGVVDKIYTVLEPLGGESAANGLRGVLELDRETKRAGIELYKRQLASMNAGLDALQSELAECDAEISRLDQKAVAELGKVKVKNRNA